MKIIFTGGHFSPAYALIERLRKDNSILVVGRKFAFEGNASESYEFKVCQKFEIPFKELKTGRLQRSFTKHTIPSLMKTVKGFSDAVKILRDEKPDVVVTFGGYIALPVALAAYFLRIPLALHDQTLRPGLSAKIISKFADCNMVSFESSKKYFPKRRTIVTGNPIRSDILKGGSQLIIPDHLPVIYVTGGSSGSHILNKTIEGILEELVRKYIVIHQSGDNKELSDFQVLKEKKEQLPEELKKNYILKKFYLPAEVGDILKKTSIIISRSGINTVTELIATGTVGLLVPLLFGKLTEQKENAVFFKELGLGEYIEQEELTSTLMLSKIQEMMENYTQYTDNRSAALKYVTLDAADKIIEEIEKLYGRRRKES